MEEYLPVVFTLMYSEEMSDEDYAVFAILIFPNNDSEQIPQRVCYIPIDKKTLDINIVDVEGEIMPTGIQAKLTDPQEDKEFEISLESIRDAIVPRMVVLMAMALTSYNFLVPEAQTALEMETALDVPTEELPPGEVFDFDNVEDFLKGTSND